MSRLSEPGVARVTSSLNEVKNDTGRIAFCGPFVLSAITGFSISKVEDEIRRFREIPEHRKPIVRGTYTDEVEGALKAFAPDVVATNGVTAQVYRARALLERVKRPCK